MTSVRPPAVAGRFYPESADKLRAQIREFLDQAMASKPVTRKTAGDEVLAPMPGSAPSTGSETDGGRTPPKAIIVPHAGYVYSGPVAASGYVTLRSGRGLINRVVLLGPCHSVPLRGLAASNAEAFETPLGRIEIDSQALAEVLTLGQVQVLEAAHDREHSLEVHLPFLQEVLGDFRLVPLVVGQASIAEVAEVVQLLWDGPETLFVISSDLSHFHDYETAGRLDRETSTTIEQMRVEQLRGERACGYRAIGGFLSVASERGLHVRTIDLRNSGDTAGSRDRVVGYGAYVVE